MFNIKNIINKRKKNIKILEKKYKNISEVYIEYKDLLKKYINKDQELLNIVLEELLEKYKIKKEDFFKYIDSKDYITEFDTLIKKHEIENSKIEKKLTDLVYSKEIPIFLDFDEIMVDLIGTWLEDYNKLVNKWLKEETQNWKFVNKTEEGKKLELVENFILFFSNKQRKYYKNLGYNIYGFDNHFLYIYNKEDLIMRLSEKEQKYIDKNYKELECNTEIEKLKEVPDIIKDIPQVFIDKLWNAFTKGKKFKLDKKDINNFYIFNVLPLGMNFLEKGNLYMDEEYENPIVKPKKDALKLYEKLKEYNLLDKTYILTSSFPGTEYSKYEYVKHIYPELTNKIITTKNKDIVARTGIMIDDGAHNIKAGVVKSDYTYGLMLNYPHNLDFATGKRIKRINNLEEVLDYLPLLHFSIYDRLLDNELTKKNLIKVENNSGINFNKKSEINQNLL